MKVWVIIDIIAIEKLVKHHSLCGQTMVTVVLIIGIAKFISAHYFPAQGFIFLLDVPSSVPGSTITYLMDYLFQRIKHFRAYFVH
jgi:hypothetical protein